MFFAVFIIIDSYKQYLSRIVQNRSRILSILDLHHCSSCIHVPFQFDDQCRIVIFILWFWYKYKVSKSSSCRQFADWLKIILHRTQICNRQYAAQRIFIVVLNDRYIFIVNFLNLRSNRRSGITACGSLRLKDRIRRR